MNEQLQRSLVILKPDALERRLAGQILHRFEAAGLDIIAGRVERPTDALLLSHYPASLAAIIGQKSVAAGTDVGDDATAYGLEVLSWNRMYMRRGPVFVMVLEGPACIPRIRAMVGFTDPSVAAPGTIRGDLGADSIARANAEKRGTENLVHASGSVEEAQAELQLWFGDLP